MTSSVSALLLARGTKLFTAVDPTLSANNTSYGGVSVRNFIAAAALTAVSGVIKVRLTLTPPTSGNNSNIAACWVGHAGTAPNFDGNQVQILFSGGATTTLTAGGSSVVSDESTFSYDATKGLIIAIEYSGTSDVRWNATAGANYTYYSKTATGESGTTSVTGYTNVGNEINSVDLVEVRA